LEGQVHAEPEAGGTAKSKGSRHFLKDKLPRTGLKEFWYPAAKSKAVGEKPTALKLLGDEVALFRDGGRVHAVHNRCPHRGLPMSMGKRHFPGTISCAYHGWTFDTKGNCVAALNEGPCSRLPGRVRLRTYPVEERNGIVWIYMGDREAKPIEEDVPAELLDMNAITFFHVENWDFNWLPGLENLMDTHDLFVHRNSPFYLFTKIPAWAEVASETMADGRGVSYKYSSIGPLQEDYPKLGRWPKRVWWRRFKIGAPNGEYLTAELRLPGLTRVGFTTLMFIRYMVPIDENSCRAFLFSTRRVKGIRALSYRIYYHLWASWSLLNLFIGQDSVVFAAQDYDAPERLSAPDNGVIKWRRILVNFAASEARDGDHRGPDFSFHGRWKAPAI
jgi:nitrite reductase/ring-hydroxylating ferredoxin subunit